MSDPKWNQENIDAAREANRKARSSALCLMVTPSVLRVLGEGIATCHDGDANDNAHADLVVEMMATLGFKYTTCYFEPSEEGPNLRAMLDEFFEED